MENVVEQTAPQAEPAPIPLLRGHSLRRNLVYALLGTGVFNACRAVMSVLMTKFGTAQVVGEFSYALNISTPVVLFCALNLRAVLIADSTNRVPFGSYLMTRTVGMIAAAAALPVVGWLWAPEDSTIDAAFTIILVGLCISKLIESEAEIYWGLYQKDERMDLVAWSNCLRGLGMLVPFAIGPPLVWYLVKRSTLPDDYIPYGTAFAVLGYVVAWAGVAVFFDRRQSRRRTHFNPAWSWPDVRRLIMQALPLGTVILLVNLTSSIPRAYVGKAPGGLAKLGYFFNMANLLQIGNLIVVQMGYTASNRLALYFRDNPRAFLRLVLKLLTMAAGISILTIAGSLVAGKWLLTIIYLPEYAEYYPQFLVLVAGQCLFFFSSLLGFAVTQMQIFWLQVVITGSMCTAAWLTARWLVPIEPVGGAAYANLAAAIVHVVALSATLIYGLRTRPQILARIEAAAREPLAPGPV